MRKFIFFIALLAAATALAQAGTGMWMADQPGSPALLVETKHTKADLLANAVLLNRSEREIVSYRIGWLALFPEETESYRGMWMNVPTGITPGTRIEVPAQAVSFSLVKRGATRIGFFVDAVKFRDGDTWQAPVKEMKKHHSKK